MNPLSLGIAGASGKFGRSILAVALRDPNLRVSYGVGSKNSAQLGQDLGILAGQESIGLPLSDNYEALFDTSTLIIDVSSTTNLENMLTLARQKSKPLVIGTTGHPEKNLILMKEASQNIPIFYAPNFSLGIAAMASVATTLSRMLGQNYTFAITETHHANKKDSPSGTALYLAKCLQETSDKEPTTIESLRIGDVIGEHTLTFSLENEEISIYHRAISRTLFARGALQAAKFLACQSPGLYSMSELLQEDVYATCKN